MKGASNPLNRPYSEPVPFVHGDDGQGNIDLDPPKTQALDGTPAAEANILNDPEAADLVFSATWPVTMVGLDVTHQVNMRNNINGIFVHDSSAIAFLLDRSLFETSKWPVKVNISDGVGRGKTWPSIGNTDQEGNNALLPWRGRPKVNVCIGVNGDKVIKLLLDQ
ncbi:MAG: nucleoside hydrolase [Spirochaetia bacterium]|nr:nucleoside hydrolase [Spirochaetia bacterium]